MNAQTRGVLYCRGTVVKGKDWRVTPQTGVQSATTTEVVTQMSERLPGPIAKFVYNMPLDCQLSSSNMQGWPQIAFALYTVDGVGKDIAVAYTRCRVPVHSGHTSMDLPLMQPVFTTPQHQLFSVFSGTSPELRDPAFLCTAEDRIVLTMKRVPGYLRVQFDVRVVGLALLGYDTL